MSASRTASRSSDTPVERLLFDGALSPSDGALRPDPARPGLDIELKARDAEKFAA
jgi:L-rhamnonate dehydratase